MVRHHGYQGKDMSIAVANNPDIGLVDITQGGNGNVHLRYDDLTSHMKAWEAPHPFVELVSRQEFQYMAEPTDEQYKADKSIIIGGLGAYGIGRAYSQIEDAKMHVRNSMLNEDGQSLLLTINKEMPKISYIAIIDEPDAYAQVRLLPDGSYTLELAKDFMAKVRDKAANSDLDEQDVIDDIIFEEMLHILGDNLPFRYVGEGIEEERRVREIKRKFYADKAKRGSKDPKYERLVKEMDYELENLIATYSSFYSQYRRHMTADEAKDYLAKCVKEAEDADENVNDYLAKKVAEIEDDEESSKNNKAETENEDEDDQDDNSNEAQDDSSE